MAGMRLRITCDGFSPRGAQVYLNDIEISDALTGLDLLMNNDDFNRATIRLLVNRVDVDAGALAMLQAHIASESDSGGDL